MKLDGRTIGIGVGLGALMLGAPMAGLAVVDSAAVGTMVGFTALLPAAVALGRGRGAAGLAFGGLAAAAVTLLMARVSLHRTLISGIDWECGTGLATLMLFVPFVMGGVMAAFLVFGRLLPPRFGRPLTLVLAVGALVVLARVAPATHDDSRPDADGWVASLPVVTTLPETHDDLQTVSVSELTITRACDRERCSLGIAEHPVDTAYSLPMVWRKELLVRRDEERGWLVFEDQHRHVAIDECTGAAIEVEVADVITSVRTPRLWRESSALALCVAFGALLWAAWTWRRRRHYASARECFVGDGGVVTFADGRAPEVGVADLAVPTGPALAFGDAREVRLPYREAPLYSLRVAPGSRASHFARLADQLTARLYLASALVCLAAAPWIAAWNVGLV